MWNDRYSGAGLSLLGRAAFDPATMVMAAGTAASVAGAGVSAAGTIAGGNYAAQAGRMQRQAAEFEAQQLESNAAGEVGAAGRRALDTRLRTGLAIGTARANAAGAGVDAAVGSPANVTGELAQRGEYQALMDMWSGQNAAIGLRDKAAGVRYSGDLAELEGEMKQRASRYAAAGTLASGFGSALSGYGKLRFPSPRGTFGA